MKTLLTLALVLASSAYAADTEYASCRVTELPSHKYQNIKLTSFRPSVDRQIPHGQRTSFGITMRYSPRDKTVSLAARFFDGHASNGSAAVIHVRSPYGLVEATDFSTNESLMIECTYLADD